jgi:D-alanyl-D-alanine carboxypeptidase
MRLSTIRRSVCLLLATAALCVTATAADAAHRHRRHHGRPVPVESNNDRSESSGRYADFVVDAKTGRVLHATNADAPRHPASLTKMMTLYIMFEELERGRFTMDSQLKVSQHASIQSPTKLGLRPGQTISVSDAIHGLVTQSANDAAVTIAENIGGSEDAFARRMTQTARRIGMSNTRFYNASGLPNDEQVTTARDMVTLGRALQERFPEQYKVFQTRSFAYRGRVYGNHNHLLGSVEGVDGIKTGYTNASGFNLVTSVKRDGHFIVASIFGGSSAYSRDAKMVRLIEAALPDASTGSRSSSVFADAKAAGRDDEKPTAPIPVPGLHDRTQQTAALTLQQDAPPPKSRVEDTTSRATPQQQRPDDRRATQIMAKAIQRDQRQHRQVVASLDDFIPQVANTKPTAKPDANDKPEKPSRAEADHNDRLMTASLEPLHANDKRNSEAQKPQEMPKAKTSSRDGWLVQVAAVDTAKNAKEILTKAQGAIGSKIGEGSPVAEAFQKGSSTFYRARFAGYSDQKAANTACAALKRKDFDCLVIRQ